MNDVLDSLEKQNPLLDIDTSFTNYLAARTRKSKDHIVGGRMDYGFDADFSVRQKFITYSGLPRKFARNFSF